MRKVADRAILDGRPRGMAFLKALCYEIRPALNYGSGRNSHQTFTPSIKSAHAFRLPGSASRFVEFLIAVSLGDMDVAISIHVSPDI